LARTVLLADDSVTAQNMGRRILTDAGYDVITVNNGSAALEKIHESHPDLIVLDVYMPGYGGLEVCQRLKESGETMRIPVLLSVGKMEPFKSDEAKRVRADAHIVKPFEASELLAALAKLEDRIVPQGDAQNGRKKKPSFWHGEDDSAARRDWTENAAYLAQVKQRKNVDAQEADGVAPEEATSVETPTKVDALPLVPEAREELPVIAESSPSVNSPDETAQQNAASSASVPANVAEGAEVATSTSDVKAIEPPAKAESERADSVADRKTTSETSSAGPIGATDNSPTLQRGEGGEVDAHPAGTADATASTSRWIAENVALTPEEAALELDQEMRAAEAAENMQPNASTGASPVTAPEETQGATFAAAAGAGSSAVASTASATNDGTEPSIPSEAAAAWENWQHIRETVMNGQTATAIAETVAQVATAAVQAEPASQSTPDGTSQEPAPAGPSAAESSSSEMETGALASLVDSVLAELKPKLMEEIAKKLKK
jgi:CheY-like chemotaxis protein